MQAQSEQLFQDELSRIRDSGLYKEERVIDSPQDAHIVVRGRRVLNLCANNYLGLANHPRLKQAAIRGIEEYGLGLASVRFICGTQTIHKELERRVAAFHGKEDAILYSSCFDANGGLFETLLGEKDAVISDSLNHASIIDGVRLCKAKRYRYEHGDMRELEAHLTAATTDGAEKILITTDGVFSMDGHIAKLRDICDLAERHGALVHVDECHATGFFGPTGRGAAEFADCLERVDIVTSTLGKALGGSSGGFTTGSAHVVDLLRQRSRPYLFSNTLAPAIVTASIECLAMLDESAALRSALEENTKFFRAEIRKLGFSIKEGAHPIVPVMIGDAKKATALANALLDEGLYVIAFSFPVVPKEQARIRTQMSAAHSRTDLEFALAAFEKAGKSLGII